MLAAILVAARKTQGGDSTQPPEIVRPPEPPNAISEAQPNDPIVDAVGDIDFAVLSKTMSSFRGDSRAFAEWLAAELEGDWFPSKVAGVSHRNDDRTSRQAAIKKLEELDLLELVPDHANKYDSNAIRVVGGYFKANFEWVERQIGFLNSRLAGETSRAMKRGTRFLCFVLSVTGEDQDTRGVNIAMVRWEPKK